MAGLVGRADVLAGLFFVGSILVYAKMISSEHGQSTFNSNNSSQPSVVPSGDETCNGCDDIHRNLTNNYHNVMYAIRYK